METTDCVCGTALTGRQRKYCSEQCQKDEARRVRLEAQFSITPEEYDLILAEQGGVCAVCKRPPKPGKRLAIDHSHKTGHVRGLLDYVCNKRILGARTDEAILALAEYVKNPPARRVLGDRVAAGRPPKKRTAKRGKRHAGVRRAVSSRTR
jgi:hypothetical protein